MTGNKQMSNYKYSLEWVGGKAGSWVLNVLTAWGKKLLLKLAELPQMLLDLLPDSSRKKSMGSVGGLFHNAAGFVFV